MNKIITGDNVFYLFLLIFCFSIYNVFLNSYIILNSTYQQRMIKYGGFCEYHGYGFAKLIVEKYNLDYNITTHNAYDYPPVSGYFYDIRKINNNNYFILINYNQESLKSFVKNRKFKIIEKIDNCFFIKFDD